MVFAYLAEYIRSTIKNMVEYYKEKPEPVFKKPDGYKNINTHSFIKVQN
jgi:hypothetical protein